MNLQCWGYAGDGDVSGINQERAAARFFLMATRPVARDNPIDVTGPMGTAYDRFCTSVSALLP